MLSTWVGRSMSGLYLPRVCNICSDFPSRHEWTHLSGLYLPRVCNIWSSFHPWHEWTHLRVGCICLECIYIICSSFHSWHEWTHLWASCICLECAIICSSFHSRHEWTHLRVGCIYLECTLYVLVFTLAMSGPISEWAVSALSMHYMFLFSLLAWVDPSVSGLYLPRVCAHYHFMHAHGMSGPIFGWAVYALKIHCIFLLLSAWVDSIHVLSSWSLYHHRYHALNVVWTHL